ncbi:AfsR/SARP family transcriptional regulator [Actinocrispum sp. NPDC049592]|uniref:AfsR/SARP family transcriptional regulator n=1 Tax=Actinocrispum sp. NPDC049592 TaxID=3154835 RepID=UPI00342D9819
MTAVELLGPVRAFGANPGPGPQQAAFAMLASKAGQVVKVEELAAGAPVSRVRTHIAGLRRVLRQAGLDAKSILASTGDGYVLRVEPDQTDSWQFDKLHRRGVATLAVGDHSAAADVLASALALWRGEALTGVPGTFAAWERDRLTERRLTATENLIRARMRLTEPAELVPELAHLVESNPHRDSLRELLMVALVRSGRRAEALLVLRDSARKPGPQLLRIQERILADDEAFFEAS